MQVFKFTPTLCIIRISLTFFFYLTQLFSRTKSSVNQGVGVVKAKVYYIKGDKKPIFVLGLPRIAIKLATIYVDHIAILKIHKELYYRSMK